MCVESHENVHNDEQSSTANNSIDVMDERIGSSGGSSGGSSASNRTNTYQIDSDMVTSTSFSMETHEPPPTTATAAEAETTIKTSHIERDEPDCRANGAMVWHKIFYIRF